MNRHARRAHVARNRHELSRSTQFRSYAELELHFRSPIRAIAHHEAAHAVACALLGLPFGDVTLLPRPELDRGRWLAERPRAPISNAVVSLAGPCSDWRLEQEEGLATDPSSNEGDLSVAMALGQCVIRPELARANASARHAPTDEERARLRAWLDGAHALARGLVQRAWPEIALAAVELLESRRLAPERVREIARRCDLHGRLSEAVLLQGMSGVTS